MLSNVESNYALVLDMLCLVRTCSRFIWGSPFIRKKGTLTVHASMIPRNSENALWLEVLNKGFKLILP